tara:strand:+ start:76748 stop:77518 length:771 start_codon:yes stop_codon:yes gene_type:complete
MNAHNIIALHTLIRREVLRFTRIWTQTLLPSPISMILYFVIFGSLIGPRIGELDGFSYVEYIAPGLIMMAIINNSYANVVGSFFGSKFQKNIEEMYVSPMSSLSILLGFTLGGVIRGLLVGLIVSVVALFFTNIQIYHFWIILLVAFFSALLFSLAGLLNAIFSKKFDDISIVPTFILTPLTYLGGVFYSIHMLPSFWQKVSYFNPMLYMVNAFRYGMLGVSDIPIVGALSFLGIFCALLFAVDWWMLEKGVGIKN